LGYFAPPEFDHGGLDFPAVKTPKMVRYGGFWGLRHQKRDFPRFKRPRNTDTGKNAKNGGKPAKNAKKPNFNESGQNGAIIGPNHRFSTNRAILS